MKSNDQRGPFGTWLREVRSARFPAVGPASAALKRQQRYGIAPSTWAELESGTRLPNDEQRDNLAAFFGSQPPAVWPIAGNPQIADPALAAVLEAVRLQTEELHRLWTTQAANMERLVGGLTSLVEELREDRELRSGRVDAVAQELGTLDDKLDELLEIATQANGLASLPNPSETGR